jgi:hypothetical protein
MGPKQSKTTTTNQEIALELTRYMPLLLRITNKIKIL